MDIIKSHPKNKIIVLCNRKVLSKGVYQLLMNQHEDAELLIDTKKIWNKKARILVSSFKKGGCGLNDPELDMAIIASDTKDVRQYEGRIRTINNLIYHIVDCYRPFENHYEECRQWYENKGATIVNINKYHVMINRHYYTYMLIQYLGLIYDVKNIIFTEFMHLLL